MVDAEKKRQLVINTLMPGVLSKRSLNDDGEVHTSLEAKTEGAMRTKVEEKYGLRW